MKIWKKITIVASILIVTIGGLFYDAYFNAPSRFSVRYETLASEMIPAQMNDVNILFFSDLYFNSFMDHDRMQKLVNVINESGADIVIFGGDLFDNPSTNPPSQETIDDLTQLLKSIKAPLGKFAVYGNNDHANDEIFAICNNILYNADFEVLNNNCVHLRNKGSQSINLVGLDSEYMGNLDIDAAYSNVNPSTYTITVCHTPDTALKVPTDITDYFLAGHSLGGQVNYIFGATYIPPLAEFYTNGKHNVQDNFTLDITNGVGTTENDVRFLANAEVVIYRLSSPNATPKPPISTPAVNQPVDKTPDPDVNISEESAAPEEQPVDETTPEAPTE